MILLCPLEVRELVLDTKKISFGSGAMVILACGRSSNYSLSLVMPLDRSFLGQLAMFDISYLCFYFLGTFFFDHDLMLRSMITNYDYKAQCSSDSSMILRFFFLCSFIPGLPRQGSCI